MCCSVHYIDGGQVHHSRNTEARRWWVGVHCNADFQFTFPFTCPHLWSTLKSSNVLNGSLYFSSLCWGRHSANPTSWRMWWWSGGDWDVNQHKSIGSNDDICASEKKCLNNFVVYLISWSLWWSFPPTWTFSSWSNYFRSNDFLPRPHLTALALEVLNTFRSGPRKSIWLAKEPGKTVELERFPNVIHNWCDKWVGQGRMLLQIINNTNLFKLNRTAMSSSSSVQFDSSTL